MGHWSHAAAPRSPPPRSARQLVTPGGPWMRSSRPVRRPTTRLCCRCWVKQQIPTSCGANSFGPCPKRPSCVASESALSGAWSATHDRAFRSPAASSVERCTCATRCSAHHQGQHPSAYTRKPAWINSSVVMRTGSSDQPRRYRGRRRDRDRPTVRGCRRLTPMPRACRAPVTRGGRGVSHRAAVAADLLHEHIVRDPSSHAPRRLRSSGRDHGATQLVPR